MNQNKIIAVNSLIPLLQVGLKGVLLGMDFMKNLVKNNLERIVVNYIYIYIYIYTPSLWWFYLPFWANPKNPSL